MRPLVIMFFALQITGFLLAILFSIFVLGRKHRHVSVTLSWIMSFFLLPFLGPLVYVIVGFRYLSHQKRKKRLHEIPHIAHDFPPAAIDDLPLRRLSNLATNLTGTTMSSGNRLRWFEEGENTYRALLDAIENATHHVHLEYYTFQPDETGERFAEVLCRKSRQGIKCRLLVDHVGSIALGKKLQTLFRESGVEFYFFSPLKFTNPWLFNFRNHRKIAIIDGTMGFIGSQNIGNEYTSRVSRNLSWKDSVVRIEGPGVVDLQRIFLNDWQFASGHQVQQMSLFPKSQPIGESRIQILPTSPLENNFALEKIFLELVGSCQERISIMTPYFVPNHTILLALESASSRGVRTDLLVPGKSDHRLVDLVGKSWFQDLRMAGIHIHVYEQSFLHSKCVTVDGKVALLGSANMDERSFHLNFECSAILYDPFFINRIEESFDYYMSQSSTIPLRTRNPRSFLTNVKEGFFRTLSPLI